MLDNQTKVCTKCGVEKSLSEFGKDTSRVHGRSYVCRVCTKKTYEKSKVARTHVVCKKCGVNKPVDQYPKPLDVRKHCFECKTTAIEKKKKETAMWVASNKERVRELDRARHVRDRAKRLAQQKKYANLNYSKIQRAIKRWRIENAEKVQANRHRWYVDSMYRQQGAKNAAKRRAAKLQATPKWADADKIADVYENARFLTEILGITCHVDHVVPLRGKNVCGIHVEHNLNVITATANMSKGAKFAGETL